MDAGKHSTRVSISFRQIIGSYCWLRIVQPTRLLNLQSAEKSRRTLCTSCWVGCANSSPIVSDSEWLRRYLRYDIERTDSSLPDGSCH